VFVGEPVDVRLLGALAVPVLDAAIDFVKNGDPLLVFV
jgi:hypothetical protein